MRIALVQTHMTWDKEDNVKRQMEMVNKAADGGAKIVALDELSNTVYFAFEQKREIFLVGRNRERTYNNSLQDAGKRKGSQSHSSYI